MKKKHLLNDPFLVSREYVRHITSLYARSFYFAAQFFPRQKRAATYALYGFARYADNLVDNPRNRTRDELLQEISHLRWEIETAYRRGESEHPVLQTFIRAAKHFDIPIEYPLDLMNGVSMDVSHSRYERFEDLYVYCYRVAGTIGLMMTHIIGYSHSDAFEYAEKLGIAMQLTNILRDILEDKERGKLYLPMKDLEGYGIDETDIFQERNSLELQNLMKEYVRRAHCYYNEAEPGIAYLDRDSRFAIYAASRIYRGILDEIEAREYNPFLGRVYVSTGNKMRITAVEYLRYRRNRLRGK